MCGFVCVGLLCGVDIWGCYVGLLCRVVMWGLIRKLYVCVCVGL